MDVLKKSPVLHDDFTREEGLVVRRNTMSSPASIAFSRQSSAVGTVATPDEQHGKIIRSKKDIFILISIAIMDFTVFCAYTMLAPFFPSEAKKKGVNLTITGIIFAIFPMVIVVCSPIVGKVIPVLGSKFTLIIGLLIEGSTQILFGFVDLMPSYVTFVTFCFVIRIATAMGSSGTSTASLTIVSQNFKENMAVAFGVLDTFLGLGLIAGPPVGGFLYGAGGFKLPFIVLGSLVLMAIVPVYLILPSDTGSGEEHETGSVTQLLRIPSVCIVAILVGLTGIALSFLDPTLANHLEPFHLSSGEVGLMFLLASAIYTLCAPGIGLVTKKLDTRLMMTVGCFLCAIGFLLLGPSPLLPSSIPKTLWLNGLSLAIFGLGLAPLFTPSIFDMNKSAVAGGMPDSLGTNGVISGLFNSMFNLGGIIGPTVAGSFSQYLGFPWASTIIAILLVLMGIVLWTYTVIERRTIRASSGENDPLLPKA